LKTIGFIVCLTIIAIGLLFFGMGESDEIYVTSTDEPITQEEAKKPIKETDLEIKEESQPTSASIREEYKNPALKRVLSDKELKELDDNVDRLEKKWDQRLRDLFLKKLQLSMQDFEDYQVMRDGFEEDRLEAFEKFHKDMAAKHGNSYRYSPTQEMKDYESKIKTDYQDLFRKRFGENTYSQYKNTLESFNDEARKTSDPELGVLYIEY
jgi:hypothetical protein